jgi:pimeloyl-ACP methyl ester carboxylesterase
MDVSSGIAEVNGAKLYYEVAGRGPALVLLNGGGLDSRMWDDQFAAFAELYRVARYDYRGSGRSEPAAEKYSHLDDLAALLDFLKVDIAVLVGASAGGALAIDYALAYPNRVRGLVLASPGLSGYPLSDATRERVTAMLAAAREGNALEFAKKVLDDPHFIPATENPSVREKARQILIDNIARFQAEDLAQPPARPAAGRLAEIGVPALILLGGRDHPEQLAIGETLESGMRGAKTVVFFGAGHMVNLENPERFNKTVLEFLSERS